MDAPQTPELELTWPDRPTCHDHDPTAQRFDPPHWHPAGVRFHPDNDHIPAFRTCSYCGSIHPEDLVKAIEAGAKLGGSDWKYGWPHKFYVEGIPNTNAGNLVTVSSHSLAGGNEPSDEQRAAAGWTWELKDGRWHGVCKRPDGKTTHGKWYNTHLHDLGPAAFERLSSLLAAQTNIMFALDGDKLKYWSPSHGYQK